MKSVLLLCAAVLLLTGCAERGDKAIAYGKGTGDDWKPAASGQMRIAVENSFTRDVVLSATAPGKYYELTVGPIRERYMIVPEAAYEIQAWTQEKKTGNVKLYVTGDDRNGAKGLRVKIRP
jgi:hypothetical protein